MPDKNDMQAVIDAARAGVTPFAINPMAAPAMLLPDGRVVDMRGYLAAPTRKAGAVTVFDAASFNQVMRDNAAAGDAAIYIDRDVNNPMIDAVLNGHGKAGPGWGDLRVRIEFRATPQWAKWKAIDGKLLGQTEFAEFIEDNLADIESPSGATMLEIATQFQATRTTAFRRAVKLSNGQVHFENIENTDTKVGAGQIEVPEEIILRLAPLHGGALYAVPARFRWRLEDGKLRLGLKMQRVEDLMSRVLDDVVAGIERSTNISVLEGRPPATSPVV